jgi:hypothetical protein
VAHQIDGDTVRVFDMEAFDSPGFLSKRIDDSDELGVKSDGFFDSIRGNVGNDTPDGHALVFLFGLNSNWK